MGDYTDFDARPEARPAGGGGFLKFCLICGCILLAIAAAGGGFVAYQFSQMLTIDPPKVVSKVEGEILPGSTVPSGYVGLMAMKIPFTPMQFAVITKDGMQQAGNNTPLTIMVCSMPAGANQQQMQQQMQQSMQQQGQGGGQMQVEAENQKVLKVRGQDVTFTEQVGVNQGVKVRQMMAVVPKSAGSSDQVLLMFMGKDDVFDQAAVDAFLSSIK